MHKAHKKQATKKKFYQLYFRVYVSFYKMARAYCAFNRLEYCNYFRYLKIFTSIIIFLKLITSLLLLHYLQHHLLELLLPQIFDVSATKVLLEDKLLDFFILFYPIIFFYYLLILLLQPYINLQENPIKFFILIMCHQMLNHNAKVKSHQHLSYCRSVFCRIYKYLFRNLAQ